MSQEEKDIWDKLPEAAKAIILGNAKTPHKPSTCVNFCDIDLGDIIKDSSNQFDFGHTPTGPSNNDLIY